MKTVLLDGDTVVYSAALAAEVPTEWDENLWTLHADLGHAINMFETIVGEIKDALKPDRVVIALSDSTPEKRWRMAVMPTYKSNRKKTRRPVVFGPLRAYCHEAYETFEREGLEGDDILGILATHKTLIKGTKVIVSIDKDLKTIPAKLYNYNKPELGVLALSENEADYNHLFQTLTGDTTDGYPGCPGIGPKTAEKILAEAQDPDGQLDPAFAWTLVVKAFEKAGLSEEVALQNARVARILRACDYNFKTKEVVLWNP